MTNNGDVQQLTATLQAKWYTTLVATLGVASDHFQLLQPSIPLGNTSDKLWEYFNNLPSQSLVNNFSAAGGNHFYDDYKAVVAQLVSEGYNTLKRDLSDYYDDWMKYLAQQNPVPQPSAIPGIFRNWAFIYAPDKAIVGYNDYQSILLDSPYAVEKNLMTV